MNVGGGQGNQGGEGGPPSILNPPPKGPTLAEIEAKKKAAKAKRFSRYRASSMACP